MINHIVSEVKSLAKGLPMAVVTFVVVAVAIKALGGLIERVAPGKGELLKNAARI